MATKFKVRISSPTEEGLVTAINKCFFSNKWALKGDQFPKEVLNGWGEVHSRYIARFKAGRYQLCERVS